MSSYRSAGVRPSRRTAISLICGFFALLSLVYVAEWVPDLLPRSPNFARSSLPYFSSPLFPIIAALIAVLGFATSVLVWRRHRYAKIAFTVFWLAWICGIGYLGSRDHAKIPKKILGLVVLIYMGIMLWRDLNENSRSEEAQVVPDQPKVLSPPRLDWWRFATMAVPIGGIIGAIAVLPRRLDRHDSGPRVALLIFGGSLISFFGYRWHNMRVELKGGRFLLDEYSQNPQRYIRGNRGVLTVWFICTIVLVFAVIFYSALHN